MDTYPKADLFRIIGKGLADMDIEEKDEYSKEDLIAIGHELGMNPPSVLALLEQSDNGNAGEILTEDGLELVVAEPEESNESKALVLRTETLPEKVGEKMDYLEEVFLYDYHNCVASRVPLREDFLRDLDSALTALGYEKQKEERYIRLRKDSEKVDVLELSKGNNYFEYFLAENEEKVQTLAKPFKKDVSLYRRSKALSIIGLAPAGAIAMAWQTYATSNSIGASFFGGMIGVMAGVGIAMCNFNIKEKDRAKDQYFTKEDSYLAGFLGVTYPHVVGKLCYDVGNKARQIGYNLKRKKNLKALQAALEPAEHFTYEDR